VFADEGHDIQVTHLPEELLQKKQETRATRGSEDERHMILDALQRAQGNKREAARLLGWYPQKLYDRLRRHGIGTDWS
jgi:transcriptional regulator of acetoin/glycerol metabolism